MSDGTGDIHVTKTASFLRSGSQSEIDGDLSESEGDWLSQEQHRSSHEQGVSV
jgi:hypothetical protein